MWWLFALGSIEGQYNFLNTRVNDLVCDDRAHHPMDCEFETEDEAVR